MFSQGKIMNFDRRSGLTHYKKLFLVTLHLSCYQVLFKAIQYCFLDSQSGLYPCSDFFSRVWVCFENSYREGACTWLHACVYVLKRPQFAFCVGTEV